MTTGLDENSILQADAALLAGLLILLTLLNLRWEKTEEPPPKTTLAFNYEKLEEERLQEEQEKTRTRDEAITEILRHLKTQKSVRYTLSMAIIGGLSIFSVSAILITLDLWYTTMAVMAARIVMDIGFAFLIVVGVLIVRNYRRIQKESMKSLLKQIDVLQA